ncbi:hypothetical protein [Nocardia alni]|uniref:hypothetical protein n=1 Tax=Nocardia alni TaxID=2815723 RepID=UPI001C2348FE|nr:hypothetical protein [Nocardia alni]
MPWLTVGGWDGRAQANAFGEIKASTVYLNIWSQSGPGLAHLTGVWALSAVVAIVLLAFAIALILRGSSGNVAHVAAATAVVVAVSTVGDVFYLLGKGPELKAMVGFGGDLGGQLGLVARAFAGKGNYPMPGTADTYGTARLTMWALVACVMSILSAGAVLAQWNHNRPRSPRRAV